MKKTQPLPCPKCESAPAAYSLTPFRWFMVYCGNLQKCPSREIAEGITRSGAIRNWNSKVRKARNAKADS